MKECPKCNLCFDDAINSCPHDGKTLTPSVPCQTILSGRYILECRLGKGGMGTVFKAKHNFLKTQHAIKIISPEVVEQDEGLLIRFRQEAILAASIHHPNVVSVTDFGVENDNLPFLVMEYIDGISLTDYLQTQERLTPATAFEIISQVALGVGEAHKKGIIHRDLKPLNIMLKKNSPLNQAVKVLDFGLAKIKSTESYASLIQAKTQNTLGSPLYMSPEQWANENIGRRTDIYSLGIILFELLAGRVPFTGDSLAAILYSHIHREIPSLTEFGVTVAPSIEKVVRWSLAKNQDDRPKTVEDFLQAYLEALLETDPNFAQKYQQSNFFHSNPTISGRKDEFWDSLNNQTIDTKARKLTNANYLTPHQNETLNFYLKFAESKDQPHDTGERLTQEFFQAHNEAETARQKASESDKLAQVYAEAQKEAEENYLKALEAQQQIEAEARLKLQSEMEQKLSSERQAREKAEVEAKKLMDEALARQEAENRARNLAKEAFEALQRVDQEKKKAESAIKQKDLEESTRRQVELQAARLAEEVEQTKKRYEAAKKEFEAETQLRIEAEQKRKKVYEEIQRIKEQEAARRKLIEEQAAKYIQQQAEMFQKQALEEQEKAQEARRLVEIEIKKREEAEQARLRAEEEARELAEKIIETQKQLEEAKKHSGSDVKKPSEISSQTDSANLSASAGVSQNFSSADKTPSENGVQDLTTQNRDSQTGEIPEKSNPEIKSVTKNQLFSQTNEVESQSSVKSQNFSKLLVRWGLIGGASLLLLITGFFVFRYLDRTIIDPVSTTNNTNQPHFDSKIIKVPDRMLNKMVPLPGGTFQMGRSDVSPEEKSFGVQYPAHPVTVERFYIDLTEVSNEEYAEFVKSTNHSAPTDWANNKPPAGTEQLPVTNVSFFDAKDFADWISKRDNAKCQLPSEEQWEYAARSGSQQLIYPWGNNWDKTRTNIGSTGPLPVGSSADQTSVGGIKDMMGNVMEWTSSTFKYYQDFPDKFKDPASGANLFITVRGLSFAASPNQMQKPNLILTYRQGVAGDRKHPGLGFRLVCSQN